AEDGIRDDLVTGVQTCALPISATRPSCRAPRPARPAPTRPPPPQTGRGRGRGRPRGARVPPRSRVRSPRPEREPRRTTRGPTPEIGRASCRERVEVWGSDDGVV